GIAIALGGALTAGSAAMVLADRRGLPLAARSAAGLAVARSAAGLTAALRGAIDIVRDTGARLVPADGVVRLRRALLLTRARSKDGARRVLATAISHPERVLAIGVLLAVMGWVAGTQTSVQSDVTKLVPSSMPALRNLHQLEHVTGVSGEIDVTVRSADVATPKTI